MRFLKKCALLSLGLFILSHSSNALMYPLSLNKRILNARTIVLGKLIAQNSYIASNNRIYTSNIIEIKAYLKGYTPNKEIIVLSEGGVVKDRAELVEPSLTLDFNHEVILILTGDNYTIHNPTLRNQYPALKQVEAYGCSQGKFTLQDGLYYDLLSEAPQSEASLFQKVLKLTGQFPKTPEGRLFKPRVHQNTKTHSSHNHSEVAKINAVASVSPNPGVAGTVAISDQITITGTGFGATVGTVEFKNADDGGVTFIQSPIPTTDIISWTDTEIIMKVPRRAGTGDIRINGDDLQIIPFTINYSHIEQNNTFNLFSSSTRQRTYLVDQNTTGGYTLKYNTAFASNLPAVAAFERALTTWRCNTFLNFEISPTTTSTAVVANEGENVIFFDPTLPPGVLGRASSSFSGNATGACSLNNTIWSISNIDIQFQNPPTAGYTWNYGPSASIAFGTTYDFESVALHELGHAHGLGHVIFPGAVMHYALFNGADARTLNPVSDIAGGTAKMDYSTLASSYCYYPAGVNGPMVPVNGSSCSLPIHLLSFKGAIISKNQHLIDWSISSDELPSTFKLYYSVDGHAFDLIHQSTTSTDFNQTIQNFNFNHINEKFNANSYYKLEQIEANGTTTAYPIIDLKAFAENKSEVFFEPGDKVIYLSFENPIASDSEWSIYNSAGQLISKRKIKANTQVDFLNATSFKSGLYTVIVTGESDFQRHKLLIQQAY